MLTYFRPWLQEYPLLSFMNPYQIHFVSDEFSRIDSNLHTMPSTFSSTMFCFSETRDKLRFLFTTEHALSLDTTWYTCLWPVGYTNLETGDWRHGGWCCSGKQARGCPYLDIPGYFDSIWWSTRWRQTFLWSFCYKKLWLFFKIFFIYKYIKIIFLFFKIYF